MLLDWELSHLGDPVEDLAWCCVRSWRFGNDDLPVGGFGTVDALLGRVRRRPGAQPSTPPTSRGGRRSAR